MIDQRFIYLLQVLEGVRWLSCLITVMSLTVVIVTSVVCYANEFEYPCSDENTKKLRRKILKISSIFSVIAILSLVFTPSKNTLIAMKLSEYINIDNIDESIRNINSILNGIASGLKNCK